MGVLSTWSLLWLLPIALLVGIGLFSLVDRPRGLKWAALGLRALAIALLALALCRPFATRPTDRLHVVFIVDVSESVSLEALERAVDRIRAGVDHLDAGDTSSILAAADGVKAFEDVDALEALVTRWKEALPDDAFRSASRLSDALLEARLAFSSGTSRRIVLLTDGLDTGEGENDLDDAIATLAREQTDVRVEPLSGLEQAEASLVALDTPRRAFRGETARLTATIASNEAMPARLRIVHRGTVVADEPVELEADGRTVVHADVRLNTSGPSVWTAEIVPDRDFFPLNNALSSTIHVAGAPNILVLHRRPSEIRAFARMMRAQEIELDVREPRGLPDRLAELMAFDAVILADIAATEMSPRQMLMLRRYVSELGGGLMMTGSDNSFGLGGYYQTPVEEVLPLTSRYEKEREQPSLAMILVIDKSGSMQGSPILLARQAAEAAVDLLSDRDEIGVVAFDGGAHVVSELRYGSEREDVQRAIATLAAGGGTFMYPAMVAAGEMLESSSARIKHMIVLSDGQTQPADHQTLVADLTASGVTVSTVALGPHADRPLMTQIAELGRGRAYETLDPTNVPQIFARETVQASRSAIKEDFFGAVRVADHPVLAGAPSDDLPFVLGYVMTQPRATAQVLLVSDTADPLLAVNRYGLGVGMAWTSDLTDRWAGEWLMWQGGGPFWAQVLRGLVRVRDARGIRVQETVSSHDDAPQWTVEIDRRDESDRPQTGVDWHALLVDDSGTATEVDVEATGLGRYRVRAGLGTCQRAVLHLRDLTYDRECTLRYDRAYPAEYRLEQRPTLFDTALAYDPQRIREDLAEAEVRVSLAPWAAMLAVVCTIGGIVLRRL